MVIPYQSLSDEALDGLLKEYCLRAWGLNEMESPETERIDTVRKALVRGELVVWYSEYEESAYLLASQDLPKAESEHPSDFE